MRAGASEQGPTWNVTTGWNTQNLLSIPHSEYGGREGEGEWGECRVGRGKDVHGVAKAFSSVRCFKVQIHCNSDVSTDGN